MTTSTTQIYVAHQDAGHLVVVAVHETDENIHSKAIVAKTVFENAVDRNDDHPHDLIVDVAAT